MIIIFSSLFSRLFPASFRKFLLDVLEAKYNSSATNSIIGKIHTNIEINPLNPINNTLSLKFVHTIVYLVFYFHNSSMPIYYQHYQLFS